LFLSGGGAFDWDYVIRFLLTKARLSFADIYFEVDGIQWDGGDAQYLEQEDVTVSIALFWEDSVAPMSIGAPKCRELFCICWEGLPTGAFLSVDHFCSLSVTLNSNCFRLLCW
jgi:hypothetical protein